MRCRTLLLVSILLCTMGATAADLPRTVARVKRSVVGVGTYQQTRSPAIMFVGTGFVTGDGLSVITNAHVLPAIPDGVNVQKIGIVLGRGERLEFRPAEVAGLDREHDLAHLRLAGPALPPLALGDAGAIQEGAELAFTGFPLGMTLGLHPATHRALLAAITPIVLPALSSRRLDAHAITRLQQAPFAIFQLDATVYPGNSGSPVYDPASGEVLGVINMTFVKSLKENAITHPSGISYAIPVTHVRELLQRKSLSGK